MQRVLFGTIVASGLLVIGCGTASAGIPYPTSRTPKAVDAGAATTGATQSTMTLLYGR